MQSKLQTYVQMLEHTTAQITRSQQSWTSFLTTATRLYKYAYPEQLMIYAQRPDATACAEYDQWNKIMRRWVKRGWALARPLKWLGRRWRPSGWDFAKRACSPFLITWQSNGPPSFCGCTPLQIFWLLAKRILKEAIAKSSAPVLPPVITMLLLWAIRNLSVSPSAPNDRNVFYMNK